MNLSILCRYFLEILRKKNNGLKKEFIFHRPLTIHPCNCTKSTASGLSIECENTNLASLSVALSNIAEQKFDVWSLVINKSHFRMLNIFRF